jgi:hypothetical protein
VAELVELVVTVDESKMMGWNVFVVKETMTGVDVVVPPAKDLGAFPPGGELTRPPESKMPVVEPKPPFVCQI